ncbi:sensor histidine kinase [Mucilaginibacter sp. UR6-11]|uniref:sensor histidine kinase n=1 Tax=Mucilaginibacter sp. UR6-11 TaxID=1435644 RepID=UPI001E573AD8|nr:histidine kinase [Mucilaginibacter sp. UR6-11]MCC8426478.1 histidine kinase [Mucilaginibacter sp. UR6-11]
MKRKHIIFLHVAVWVLLILNHTVPLFLHNAFHSFKEQPHTTGLFIKYCLTEVGFCSITALCFYSNYLFVAPQLFVKRNYFKAALYIVLILLALIGWRYIVEFWFFKPVLGFDNYGGRPVTAEYYISNIFYYYFPAYFVYGIIYFFAENWYRTKQREQELQKEQAAAELTFLRSQINPHFLFNSINDIYALTHQHSDQAPVALLKLSEILRYMQREGNADLMPLQSEIKYLENVIELQCISAKGNAYIDLAVGGYIGSQQIATLLFISFVENAFKHGILTDPANPVQMHLQATNDKVRFDIRNKKNNYQKDKLGGIGLSNVRRRLLLMYPGKHNLVINEDAGFYTVNLELQLT